MVLPPPSASMPPPAAAGCFRAAVRSSHVWKETSGERSTRGSPSCVMKASRRARRAAKGSSPQFTERNAAADIVAGDALHCAMQIDRRGMARLAQQRDNALRLAQKIRADEMRTLREQRSRAKQLRNLLIRIAMAKNRQRKGRLGDEHIALHELKRHACRVGHVLVV